KLIAADRREATMQVAVKGRNIPVTEALEQYATKKVERIAKFFDDGRSVSRAEVELTHERNPSIPEPEVAETTLFINGAVLKAREASADMYASIDRMSDKLERQVRRYRGRQLDRWQGQKKWHAAAEDRSEGRPVQVVEDDEEEVPGTRIVRTKQFQMKPMSPEEATLQMELLDHAFFVFINADTGEINVVYRRRDGNYGLIEPAR
ncbi:MAG TPA: ribosome-associated translation inhibitor RaiA, partial [Rubrobacteraceae bacterium]|nr:ribosome-associated translation inhibitor RaiA [Rubrobacteraceae bacterium]